MSIDNLARDYAEFCAEEERRIGWCCGASADDHLACHVTNPNALYYGHCATCPDGVKVEEADGA